MNIQLRPSVESDIEIFFNNQLDKEANYMAAFTPKDPTDNEAYMSKFSRLLGLPTINMKTILYNNQIAGTVMKFEMDGETEITYAINKSLWGKGITTAALQAFLPLEPMRPLFGRTAFDNYGSMRVLEKCGFQKIGTDKGLANATGKEIKEIIFRLL